LLNRLLDNRDKEDYLKRTFRISVQRFEALPDSPAKQAVVPTIEHQLGMNPAFVDWSDLYALEVATVRASPLRDLPLLSRQFADRYKSIAGFPVQAYVDRLGLESREGHITSAENAPIDPSDLINVLTESYSVYSLARDKEDTRTRAIVNVAVVNLVLFVMGMLLIKLAYGPSYTPSKALWTIGPIWLPTMMLVIWAGALGGMTSLLWRLSQVQTRSEDTTTLLVEVRQGIRSASYTSPVVGAVFAFILYAAFCAHLIDGELFPSMKTAPSDDTGKPAVSRPLPDPPPPATVVHPPSPYEKQSAEIAGFILEMEPEHGRDFSLILVWAFIAGFFEKFVPDSLDKLVKKSDSSGKGGR